MAELIQEEVRASFMAVRSFLQAKNYNPINRSEIECEISVDYPTSFQYDIEFECIDHNESYVLRSDAFKANGYYRPVWSSYHLFSWDGITKELKVELENKKYTIKHTI